MCVQATQHTATGQHATHFARNVLKYKNACFPGKMRYRTEHKKHYLGGIAKPKGGTSAKACLVAIVGTRIVKAGALASALFV